jgi:hypothetical protein
MVKRFDKTQHIQNEDDYDIDDFDEEEEDEISSEEIINEAEILEYKREKIREEFLKFFNKQKKSPSWLETLDTTTDIPMDPSLNVDDDIKRELNFYNMSLINAISGINLLKKVIL